MIFKVYREVREKIQNGDILSFRGSWWFSRLIQWYTKQEVSHIGLAIWLRFGIESKDRLCILESMDPGGIRLLPLSHILPEYWASDSHVYWQKLDPKINGVEVLGWALQQWGKKYASWLQFLGMISPKYRDFRSKIGLPIKVGEDRYHCSELVTRAFMAAGYQHDKEPAFTTPGDVTKFSCLGPMERLVM